MNLLVFKSCCHILSTKSPVDRVPVREFLWATKLVTRYYGTSGLELEQSVRDTLKTSIEEFSSGMQILSDASGTVKQGCERFDTETMICSELTDLCYRFFATADTMIQISVEVLGTELHYSLGNGESAVVIGAEIPDGDCAEKYEAVSGVVSVLADVIESITQFVSPPEHKTVVLSEVEAIKRRYRLLYELDPDDLDDYDDMTLEDVDYMIL